MGYATGQFGKNHLGDLNEFLPTVHGFDEFFGYLYHLDAMEDPAHRNYPQALLARSVRATWSISWATNATIRPSSRAGARSASSGSRTPARSIPKRMETVDDEILGNALKFVDKARGRQQALLPLAEPHAHARGDAPLRKVRSDAQL